MFGGVRFIVDVLSADTAYSYASRLMSLDVCVCVCVSSLFTGAVLKSHRQSEVVCGVRLTFTDYRVVTYIFIAAFAVSLIAAIKINFAVSFLCFITENLRRAIYLCFLYIKLQIDCKQNLTKHIGLRALTMLVNLSAKRKRGRVLRRLRSQHRCRLVQSFRKKPENADNLYTTA